MCLMNGKHILVAPFLFIMALFSNIVTFEEKKANRLYFKKRAANFIRMRKIALSTLKSAFRF